MPVETVVPLQGKRVWVAGHRGMVGSALVRRLAEEDCSVLTAERSIPSTPRSEMMQLLDGAAFSAVFSRSGRKSKRINSKQSSPAFLTPSKRA